MSQFRRVITCLAVSTIAIITGVALFIAGNVKHPSTSIKVANVTHASFVPPSTFHVSYEHQTENGDMLKAESEILSETLGDVSLWNKTLFQTHPAHVLIKVDTEKRHDLARNYVPPSWNGFQTAAVVFFGISFVAMVGMYYFATMNE